MSVNCFIIINYCSILVISKAHFISLNTHMPVSNESVPKFQIEPSRISHRHYNHVDLFGIYNYGTPYAKNANRALRMMNSYYIWLQHQTKNENVINQHFCYLNAEFLINTKVKPHGQALPFFSHVALLILRTIRAVRVFQLHY